MRPLRILTVLFILFCIITASACAGPMDLWRTIYGTSTKSVEDSRPGAVAKVLGYEYGTCYVRTEALLSKIPHLSIYAKNEDMIAVYYNSVNISPVGIFFTEVDETHTRLEVSSPSPDARDYVAKSVFAGEVQPDTEKTVIEVPQPVGGKYQ